MRTTTVILEDKTKRTYHGIAQYKGERLVDETLAIVQVEDTFDLWVLDSSAFYSVLLDYYHDLEGPEFLTKNPDQILYYRAF